ncbi:MAG: Crp/Fnr family transcriptional regulator [Candidatus Thermoplasmatota archaeon]|nr:Crp/Fnr family transcriptional regulator [Candidatus Thermoplasmatota archaeon]
MEFFQVPVADLLSRIPDGDRLHLLRLGKVKNFAKGEFIFSAGETSHHVFLLLEGRIKIYQSSTVGKEAILWFCFAGELFGLAEAARGGTRVVNAQACDVCKVLCIRQEEFTAFLETHPKTSLVIMQLLACRLRVLGNVVINLISDDVRTRILKMVLQLSARCGIPSVRGLRLDIVLTHQEIADMIGTTRQTVTTMLGQLEREGLLTIDHHKIHITSSELLAQIGHTPIMA